MDAKKLDPEATYRRHNVVNDRRKSLNDRVLSHRNKRDIYMANLGEPDHQTHRVVQSGEPEYAELALPSSYRPNTLNLAGLRQIGEKEGEIRRAVCNEALRSLRSLLGTQALAIKWKGRNIVGECSSTRAEVTLKAHRDKIEGARWRYNNSRDALMRLDIDPSDQETYRVIDKADLKYLHDYLDGDSRGLGQGLCEIPWFWRTAAIVNDEEWQLEGMSEIILHSGGIVRTNSGLALRVEWFRARQRSVQWEEELKLLKRDMIMSMRGFDFRQCMWHERAAVTGLPSGMSEYAARQSNFYRKLKDDVVKRCDVHVKVRTHLTLPLEICPGLTTESSG